MTVQPTRDQLEAELDSWMARAYEAEKRAWQAEARIKAARDAMGCLDTSSDPALHDAFKVIRHALDGHA
ncbi:hypothetical protein [Brachybacterium paraconglomeratum]|uniref:hypothetical protein n=1 Tax=Brachybacterium paraconglomeratum TaxID=173362 RepID=UPI00026C68FD|nr:hypothetical protein [Brachybacterium paraconglomeratum]